MKMTMICRYALALMLYCPLFLAANPAPGVLQPRDLFDLEWAENPQISPDAREVVYQRMGFDIMTDRRTSRLWKVELASGRHLPLNDDVTASGAVWSPDGKRLAWVSRQNGRGCNTRRPAHAGYATGAHPLWR